VEEKYDPMSTVKKTPWPENKPLPKFKSLAEEEKFWMSHTFEDGPASSWEEVEREPVERQARTHVYRVRLDDSEIAKLKTLAKRRGVPVSVVLRELVRTAA
jgi:hypothetical protein